MEVEVGIINWLFYFLLDNKSLSVYSESSRKQNLSLTYKAKLHLPILDALNNSKKLNSVIARALDEISEKTSLTNNLASIIIDDSLLSHSLIIRSKKYKTIDEQIALESDLKWGNLTKNLYFISEERKTPKNIFHSVAMHHFLREKIKLNFNNFGLSIRYIVPLSSILTTSLKSTQFAVLKNGKKFQFFGNTRKGFMFFKATFNGSKKVIEKSIGLLDVPNIKKSELEKNSLKFIFFNKTKIVEYLANYIFKDVPLLNFADSNRVQIYSGSLKLNNAQYAPSSKGFNFNGMLRNLSSGFLSLLVLALILSLFSNYNFMNIDNNLMVDENIENVDEIIEKVNVVNSSDQMITNLKNLPEKFPEIKTFLLTEENYFVNGQKVEIEEDVINFDKGDVKVSFNELLINLFEIENELKFKVFESELNNQPEQNVVLRFSTIENSLLALDEIKKFGNLSLRKAAFDSESSSLHLYLTILK